MNIWVKVEDNGAKLINLHLRPTDQLAANPIPARPPARPATYLPLFVSPQKLYVVLLKSLSLGETSMSWTSSN